MHPNCHIRTISPGQGAAEWRAPRSSAGDRPARSRLRIAPAGHDRRAPVLVAGELVGHLLPLARAPTPGGAHERGVLAQVHEGGKAFEAEALDESPLRVAPDEPVVDLVAEDALGDRGRRGDADDRAHVAVAERSEDALDDPEELRAFGTVGENEDRKVENGRPVVERARPARI